MQFDQRRLTFEFDMIQNRWDQSLSPGNEQSFYWGSAAADNPGNPQLYGREESRGRRHDLRHAGGPRPRSPSSMPSAPWTAR